jgi:hypothetical protein
VPSDPAKKPDRRAPRDHPGPSAPMSTGSWDVRGMSTSAHVRFVQLLPGEGDEMATSLLGRSDASRLRPATGHRWLLAHCADGVADAESGVRAVNSQVSKCRPRARGGGPCMRSTPVILPAVAPAHAGGLGSHRTTVLAWPCQPSRLPRPAPYRRLGARSPRTGSVTYCDGSLGPGPGCRGTARGTTAGRIRVHCVRSGQISETFVQAERSARPSSPLLIRGFGVRVPGGAPAKTCPDGTLPWNERPLLRYGCRAPEPVT